MLKQVQHEGKSGLIAHPSRARANGPDFPDLRPIPDTHGLPGGAGA